MASGGVSGGSSMLAPEFVTAMTAPSGSDDSVGLAWLLKQTLNPLLEFCIQQGDVQTCVAVSVVVSGAPGFDSVFTAQQMTRWQTVYIGELPSCSRCGAGDAEAEELSCLPHRAYCNALPICTIHP